MRGTAINWVAVEKQKRDRGPDFEDPGFAEDTRLRRPAIVAVSAAAVLLALLPAVTGMAILLDATVPLRFEAQIGNLFNRTIYCNPQSNWGAANFGQVFTQCNTARSVQFGFRFDF